MNFEEEMNKRTLWVNDVLDQYLPQEQGFAAQLSEAMNYSVTAGGKRIRPILMETCFELFGGEGESIRPFAAAIEMIHTHSLVHDDLPALDNDDYRRGNLTTHKMYGEALAVLSGDALLNYAYETAFDAFSMDDISCEVVAVALQVLAEKTGIYGMLGGQSADVLFGQQERDVDMLDYIYANKTSALIEAAMMIGSILAGADEEEVYLIESVAYHVGLAFQIQDDILDITGTTESLGKTAHSDEKNSKVTYVTLRGVEQSNQDVQQLYREALQSLRGLSVHSEFLELLIESLAGRDY